VSRTTRPFFRPPPIVGPRKYEAMVSMDGLEIYDLIPRDYFVDLRTHNPHFPGYAGISPLSFSAQYDCH
jgi:hypothetical protein